MPSHEQIMTRLDFDPKNLASDIGTSVTMALVAIPDAIASAFLAGGNPTYCKGGIQGIVKTLADSDHEWILLGR